MFSMVLKAIASVILHFRRTANMIQPVSKVYQTTVHIQKRSPNTRVAADQLLSMIRQSNSSPIDEHPLLPAYVVSVCAAIEYRLNHAYIQHFRRLLGDNYEAYASPCLRLRIEEKLGLLIPLISEFRLEVDRKNSRVLLLFRIFRLRNRLIHQVPHYHEAIFERHEDGSATIHPRDKTLIYAHSHSEWSLIQRRDLVAIHASLNFWMPWLYEISYRIRQPRFNHKGILRIVGGTRQQA
jgi:hypothetical protein